MPGAETDYFVKINNGYIDETVWGAYITLMPGDVLTYSAEEYLYSARVEYESVIDCPSISSGHYLPAVASITDSTITGLTAHGYEQRIVITQVSGMSGTNDYSALSAGSITCTVGGVSIDLIGADAYGNTGIPSYYYGSIAGMTGDVVVTVTGTGYGIGVWMDFGVTYSGTQRMMVANTSGEITTLSSDDQLRISKSYDETIMGEHVTLNKFTFSYGDIDGSSSTYTKYTSGVPFFITNNEIFTDMINNATYDDSAGGYFLPFDETTYTYTMNYGNPNETSAAFGALTFSYFIIYFYFEDEGLTVLFYLCGESASYPLWVAAVDAGYADSGLPSEELTFTISTSSGGDVSVGGTLTIGSTELTEANLIKLLALLE